MKDLIQGKSFQVGDLFFTEEELMGKFDLSRGTVRQAISSLVEKGLLIKERGKGTFIFSKQEKEIPVPHVRSIGVTVYTHALRFQGLINTLIHDMNYIAEEENFHIVLLPFSKAKKNKRGFLWEKVQHRGLDGVLIAAEEVPDEEILKIKERDFPLVLLARYSPHPSIPSIEADHADGVEKALRYFQKLGHRRVAYMSGPSHYRIEKARIESYYTLGKRMEMQVGEELVRGAGYAGKDAFVAAKELFSLTEPPSAIIMSDILFITGLMGTLRELHLSVPKDVSLVALNELPLAQINHPSITTVGINKKKMVRLAFEILTQQIEGKSNPDIHLQLEMNLNLRNSCRSLVP